MPPKKTIKLSSFDQGSVNYKVGDCVLVRGDGDVLPYIGRLKEIQQSSRDLRVQLAWFYRPEEALGGRKQFHGERELFKSDHLDWCHASTIEGKCRVHNLANYQALKKVGETDFFSRFIYKPSTHEFRPDRVPVYCVCEMPYNPDTFMVMCEKCEEWYHPKCLGYTQTSVEGLKHFVCPECNVYAEKDAKKPRRDS